MRGEATIIMRGINHYYINNRGANFPHLQQMAELRRNQRAEIGRRHVMAHYAAASVRFCCHLAHPDQRRNMSDTPWNRDPRPLLLTKNVTGSCTSPSYWCVRIKETRPGCPHSNPNTSPYLFQASFRRGQNGEESLFERGEGYTEISRRLVYQFSKNDSNWRGEASKKGEGMGERDRERERERERNPTVGFLSESAEPLWNSTAYLVYSKIFKLTEYALFVLTLRMCLLESYKSVTTTTFSKVWTFSSLRTRPMSSSSKTFDRFVLVTVHPPYFSINFTKGSFPRLLMAVVLRQEL